MNNAPTRALLLTVAMLTMAAVAASPAHARITPVGVAESANSTDSSFAITAAIVIRCPTSTFTGTIAADGLSSSGVLEFSPTTSPRVTCTSTILGSPSSVTVRCSLRITLRSTSSTAGVSMIEDLLIDAANPANACSITLDAHGCSITVATQTIRGLTFDQRAQTLAARGVRVAATGSGGLCGGARTSTFTGTYRVTTPRFTIS